jgi:hypothetical protein
MSCLGVHFALTKKEVSHLRALEDEQDRLDHLQEVIEEHYLNLEKEFAAQSDKSWDAMHRALADGKLSWDGGDYPLNHTVLAGELLYTDSDYIMSLKTPEQVRDIAAALSGITEADFRRRYDAIDANSYGGPLSDEDFSYTWHGFQGVSRVVHPRGAGGTFRFVYRRPMNSANHTRQPTPVGRQACIRASLARRACAERLARSDHEPVCQ